MMQLTIFFLTKRFVYVSPLLFISDTVQPYLYVRIISCAPSLAVFSRVFVSIQQLIKMA